MSEQIEHQLNQLNGKFVNVVRPFFGKQSDSWAGMIQTVNNDKYPLLFQFVSSAADMAIIFITDDVVKIDYPSHTEVSVPVIRLKGPQDYCIISQMANA